MRAAQFFLDKPQTLSWGATSEKIRNTRVQEMGCNGDTSLTKKLERQQSRNGCG